MSHWQAGKLGLACSYDVLRQALINIVPEWEKNIGAFDTAAGQSADNRWQGQKGGFNFVVKLGSSDMGFKQEAGGEWSLVYDSYVLPSTMRGSGGPEGAIIQEVSAMRTRAITQAAGVEISADEEEGDDRVIDLIVPAGDEAMYQ
jgi:hypothetical protein